MTAPKRLRGRPASTRPRRVTISLRIAPSALDWLKTRGAAFGGAGHAEMARRILEAASRDDLPVTIAAALAAR